MVRGSGLAVGVRQAIVERMQRGNRDADDHGRWLAQPNLVVAAGILPFRLTGKLPEMNALVRIALSRPYTLSCSRFFS
jgi:hypothetical protein